MAVWESVEGGVADTMAGASVGFRCNDSQTVVLKQPFITVEGANVVERRMPWAVCLWPGLPSLWTRGAWLGLALAVACGILLNFLIVATWVWSEWVDPGMRMAGWSVLLGLWLVALVAGRRGWNVQAVAWRRWSSQRSLPAGISATLVAGKSAEALFREAQSQYLQGNWLSTETVLRHLLRDEPRDVDARLMLATLYRHVGRVAEAAVELGRVERLEEAEKWRQEIRAERACLAQVVREHEAEVEESGTVAPRAQGAAGG